MINSLIRINVAHKTQFISQNLSHIPPLSFEAEMKTIKTKQEVSKDTFVNIDYLQSMTPLLTLTQGVI